MPTTSRITSNGIFFTTGTIDEATYNPNSGYIKNYLSYSEEFDNAVWNKTASGTGKLPVITPNFGISPDGTLTADRIDFDSGGAGNSSIENGGIVVDGGLNPKVGTTRTFSVWMRSLTGTTQVAMYNAENIISVTVTSDWQRFSYTYTFTSAGAYGVRLAKREIWTSGGAASVLVWGAQWEQNSNATEYVKTGANGSILSNIVNRISSNGNYYITGTFDEIVYNRTTGYNNLFNNTASFNSVNWQADLPTRCRLLLNTSETLAPDGTQTAAKLVDIGNTGSSFHSLNYNTLNLA
jgi:hypothetical protein